MAACNWSRGSIARQYNPGEGDVSTELKAVTGVSDVTAEIELGVFRSKANALFVHHSLMFFNEKKCFLIELLKGKDEQRKEYATRLNLKSIDPDKYPDLKFDPLGVINISILELYKAAQTTLANMGRYNAILNNCQDFCSQLAGKLGCKRYLTDTDKTAAAVGVGAIFAAGIAGIFVWLTKSDDNSD